ncbi:MAG: hypothetical protein A2Z99_02210 [Treponema sp. GWB1_62_6]|nr:MAG: hypothetical protein A2Y36_10185 [Treponema sp. GWA1_62_8]OHE65281.1 MAG: hypothetical protein A2001_03475 [Treponema sp. GWC1_61_84]OHE69686.1 MAG: hypothetical protein A2Z99_02210 [Treponema sp. GWB1_62_6]OHE75197.1 MAG: hypothetical protein A2413_19770 [Treponema sp. RIFOXYC1_FULL_61_9]HCM28892.1 hypothetical protein [Treponema sp.]
MALISVSLALAGCEKRDLSVSEILPKACASCHGSDAEFSIASARAGYELSIHRTGGNAFYSNGGGCQKCHTNEGFVKFVTTGETGEEGFERAPSQPACFTCHDPHGTGTFELRVVKPVRLTNAAEFDGGKGNVCATCHQSRADATVVAVETEASKVNARFGPHYGPQGDLFAGTGAYEYPGKTYGTSPHTTKLTDSCVACHKTLPEGRFSLDPGIGGHSFNIKGEVHGVKTLNASVCQSCHPGIKQVAGGDVFDRKALADYDRDGTLEPFQLEFEGLLALFVNGEGTGILQAGIEPAFYDKNGALRVVREGVRPQVQMAALFNYRFFVEDRSRGIHNPLYAVQILYDSIKSIDPSFDLSYRP